MKQYLYLIIDIFTLSYPLASSFESRVRFVRFWPGIFTGIFFMGLVFVPWDIWFTATGIWGFNDTYLSGFFAAGLPIEEWLFFIVVPFACMFIYEVLHYFFPVSPLEPFQRAATLAIALISFALAVSNVDRIYTFLTFSLLCLGMVTQLVVIKGKYMGHFYFAYLIVLIPFTLVNGCLTGLFTDAPIVWYNNAENLGIRALTIPVDDFGYNMLMLLMVTTVHEAFKQRKWMWN